ncbi:hypothetical protein [Salicibibacter kimchii]|uniref:Flagellar hook-length control protein FliK n=1 Tax=Salicibibacter kimchii TaxID=2099786 RepID=A0A345BWS4_9BACI|nr:hypothetical protein [Salicibibacter kimchii]AXF55405.1 hypothetical protein DT065_04790 [Salicibibacter kimchii]
MDIAALSSQFNTNAQSKPTFRVGQMFSGTVSRLFSGQLATIETGQHTLVAKLETALTVGNRYLFHVQSLDGLPRLKVEPLSSGLPEDKYQRALAQQLLKDEIPFSRSALMQAAERLKGEGRLTDVHLQLAQRAIEKQLPTTPAIWQALKSAHSNPQSLSGQIRDLPSEAARHLQEQGRMQAGTSAESRLQQLAALADSNRSESAGAKQVLARIGGNTEALMQLIQSPANLPATERLALQFLLTREQPDTSGLQTMLASLGRPADDTGLQVLNVRTLIQAGMSQDRQQFLPLLQQSLGFHLLNTDPSQGSGFVPLHLDDHVTDGFMQWHTHAHERRQEDAATRVLFFLKLKHLEDTVLDLFIKETNIAVQIYNDHKEPGVVALLKPMLAEKLEEQGFRLVSYHWNQTEKRAETKDREPMGRGGFDVRV